MGIAGNKGAVAIRMDYGDTSFCFVAAHLASGSQKMIILEFFSNIRI
jgi:hypothetical protein